MSFAVIQTGGKQYKVKAGEILKIEKLQLKESSKKIEFSEDSLIGSFNDDNIDISSNFFVNKSLFKVGFKKNSDDFSFLYLDINKILSLIHI